MRKVLQNNKKTKKYLKKLKPIYVVGCWAHYGYFECPYAKTNKDGIPLVYQYDDFNGTRDEYHLRKITDTTTGTIYFWTFSKDVAKKLSDSLNYSEDHIIFNKY